MKLISFCLAFSVYHFADKIAMIILKDMLK